MWDRVLDGETRYIKGFKTTADFLLDTSFTYELGLIAKLLRPVSQRFTLEEPWSVLLLQDARVIHESTPIQPAEEGGHGHRDTLVVTLRAGGFLDPSA